MTAKREGWLDEVKFGADGLAPVVVQDGSTGLVLMLAWANREALERTLATGRMHYYSRSRGRLWMKGEESGNIQDVCSLSMDCDGDAVLATVKQKGAACHTGSLTCFHRHGSDLKPLAPSPEEVLRNLWGTILQRRTSPQPNSYTVALLTDRKRLLKKVGEEATELVIALQEGKDDEIIHEAADLLYHVLVGLASTGVGLDRVMEELARRRTVPSKGTR